jgi:signal transduction histidine kinase
MALLVLGFMVGNILNIRKINNLQSVLAERISLQGINLIEERNRTKKNAEELKILNATKDKFFSIIAHDLKNPFNSLLGFSELLKNDFDSLEKEDMRKFIDIIHDSSNHGFNLLENLLQWSRTQTGTIEFYPRLINIHRLIVDCINIYQNNANKKHIQIFNDIPEDFFLFGDKEMLSTVFRNLISNAIKFTLKNGKVKIKVQKNSRNAVISVIDTGVGVPEEKIRDLFKIDVQVSTMGTSNEKGTGLGLILCKEFVEKHGGKIKVESERKNGSEFKVILPVKHQTVDHNVATRRTEPAYQQG